jgi:hypothetical protein
MKLVAIFQHSDKTVSVTATRCPDLLRREMSTTTEPVRLVARCVPPACMSSAQIVDKLKGKWNHKNPNSTRFVVSPDYAHMSLVLHAYVCPKAREIGKPIRQYWKKLKRCSAMVLGSGN